MSRTPEQLNREIVIIPKGTMLNQGPHEDDDFVYAKRLIRAQVIEEREGAKIVRFKDNGKPVTLYLHQPVSKLATSESNN